MTPEAVSDPVSPRRGAVLTSAELDGISRHADWQYWLDPRAATGDDEPLDVSRWIADLDLLVELGIGEIIFTPEWARLEPRPGVHDPVVCSLIRDILGHAHRRGLRIWLCLLDGSAPGWFTYDEHGFGDTRARGLLWPRHVEWVGETFGDLADGWIGIREPVNLAVRSRLLDLAPPGGRDRVKGAEAIRDLLLAEAEALRVLHNSAPVAGYHSARVPVADDGDVKATRHRNHWDQLLYESWSQALIDGSVTVGDLPPRSAPILRDAYDEVFIQLRPPVRIDGEGTWTPHGPTHLIERLLDGLARAQDVLGERAILAVADLAPCPDPATAGGLHYLDELMAGAEEVGTAGWFQSSPIDGFHWEAGDRLNPGIIGRDRVPKPAAAALGHQSEVANP